AERPGDRLPADPLAGRLPDRHPHRLLHRPDVVDGVLGRALEGPAGRAPPRGVQGHALARPGPRLPGDGRRFRPGQRRVPRGLEGRRRLPGARARAPGVAGALPRVHSDRGHAPAGRRRLLACPLHLRRPPLAPVVPALPLRPARAGAQVLLRRGLRRGARGRAQRGRLGRRRRAGEAAVRGRRGRRRSGRGDRGRCSLPHAERVLPELRPRVPGRRRDRRRSASAAPLQGGGLMLTAIWLVPAVGALLVGILPRRISRPLGLVVSLAALAVSLAVAVQFDGSRHGYQFEEYVPWVGQYGIAYHLGVDGISLWLVVLNALLTVVAVLAAGSTMPRLRGFVAMLLLMEAAMAGVFLAADLLLFYVFWEFQLIPAYFLVWQWGEGGDANRAALKFVL